jgi:hypothetical protein
MRGLLAFALAALLSAEAFAADGFIGIPPDSTGKKIDTSELTVGPNLVERQRYVIADPVAGGNLATVTAAGALKVDGSGATQPVSGSVSVANFPATQPVSGTVSVGNFPASQNVVCTSGCSSSSGPAFGAAFPATGQAIGMSQGGNLVAPTGTGGNLNVNLAGNSFGTLTVGGSVSVSNFPATQPVSIAGSVAVTGTFFQATQPVSVASLPLPTGASTAAKQPALGTAGTPSADVLSVQGVASMTALKVDPSGVTSPVSAASLPLPTGAATSALQTTGNTSLANLDVALSTRLKPADTLTAVTTVGTITNPVAVTGTFFQATQPVSGTVTANQGTAAALASAWPVKQTDGTNVAPTGDVAARAGFVQITDATNTATVDATRKALRISQQPFEQLGTYSINANVAYTATTANGEIFAFRWGDATRLCVLLRVRIQVVASAFTTAGLVERQLILARSWTVSDSGGTALTPSKHRASFGTSLVTDVRIGGFLTAGTHTFDAVPISSAIGWMGAVGNVIGSGSGSLVTLYDATNGTEYPIVFAQNEGFVIRLGAAETASTRMTFVSVDWAEVNAY